MINMIEEIAAIIEQKFFVQIRQTTNKVMNKILKKKWNYDFEQKWIDEQGKRQQNKLNEFKPYERDIKNTSQATFKIFLQLPKKNRPEFVNLLITKYGKTQAFDKFVEIKKSFTDLAKSANEYSNKKLNYWKGNNDDERQASVIDTLNHILTTSKVYLKNSMGLSKTKIKQIEHFFNRKIYKNYTTTNVKNNVKGFGEMLFKYENASKFNTNSKDQYTYIFVINEKLFYGSDEAAQNWNELKIEISISYREMEILSYSQLDKIRRLMLVYNNEEDFIALETLAERNNYV